MGARWAVAVKPGQQRTRAMPHSSRVATADLEGQKKGSRGAKVKQSGGETRRLGGGVRGRQGRAASKEQWRGAEVVCLCDRVRESRP